MARLRAPVLLLAYYFPPTVASGAARAERFAKYLERLGYDVRVTCSGDGRNESLQEHVWEAPGRGRYSAIVRVLSGILRALQSAMRVHGWQLPWIPYATSAAVRCIGLKPVVISTYPPLATHLCALWLKWRYGVRWIADFRDPVTMRPALRFLQSPLERLVFRFADVVVANTDVAAEDWQVRYPRWSQKVRVIWNGFDPEETLVAAVLSPRDQRVLAHVGDIYGARHPGIVLDSFDRLVAKGSLDPKQYRIHLIGPIDSDSATFDRRSFHRLQEMGCLTLNREAIPRRDALQAAAEADSLLLLDITGRQKGVQVPAKLFDYLRVGRPILAVTTPESPTERILRQSGIPCVILHTQDRESETDSKLLSFLNVSGEVAKPNEWFWTEFDGFRQVEHLASIIDEVGGSGVQTFAKEVSCSEKLH